MMCVFIYCIQRLATYTFLSLSHYLFTESEKYAICNCYWKLVLRITNGISEDLKYKNFVGNIIYPMPSAGHLVNLNKSTTLGTPLCKNAGYAPGL